MADNKSLRLEIVVDDKGTPVVKQFGSEVSKAADVMETKGRKSTQNMDSALGKLDLSFGKVIKGAAGMAAGFAGFQGAAAVITGAVKSMAAFEAEMANVNTLLGGSTVSMEQLRKEVIKLPPELGSTTELAKGLYQALSAGVEPAKAVAFVGDAAKLAAAGLTETDTAVKVLTAAMDAYGLGAEKAGHISDVLFTAVKLGKTDMDGLASSISNVLPIAQTMGVSFEETAATVTTLTKAFPSVDQAVTGLRSAFSSMIQNADKFRALGIDLKQVIAEKGLTGAMEALKTATGGNIETLQKLVPDIEGLSAVVALTGAQFDTQKENVKAFNVTLGATDEAHEKIQNTAEKAAEKLANTWDRLIQQAGDELLPVLTDVTNTLSDTLTVDRMAGAVSGLRVVIAGLTGDGQALAQVWTQMTTSAQALDPALAALDEKLAALDDTPLDELRALQADLDKLKAITQGTSAATNDLGGKTKVLTDAMLAQVERAQNLKAQLFAMGQAELAAKVSLDALTESTETATEKTKTLEERYKTFNLKTPYELHQTAQSMVKDFEAMARGAVASQEQIADAATQTVKAMQAAYGKDIPDALKATYDKAMLLAKGMDETSQAFAEFGLQTPKQLQEAAQKSIKAFEVLEKSGVASQEQLSKASKQTIELIKAAYGDDMPPAIKAAFEKIEQHAKDTVDPIGKAGQDAGKGFAAGIEEGASEAMKALDALLAEADAAFNALNNKAAIEKRNATKNGKNSQNESGNGDGTTPDSPDTDPYKLKGNFGLGNQFGPIEHDWAKTEAGLRAQITDYRKQYTNVANGLTAEGLSTIGTRGYREAILPVLTEIIAEGERRLKELTDDATEALDRAATGSSGTSRSGSQTSNTSRAQGVGRSAGRADATEALVMRQTPLGGGSITIGRGRGYDPDFVQGRVPVDYSGVLLPSNVLETNQSGVSYTRQGDVLRPGSGEALLSKDLAEGLRQLVAQGGSQPQRSVVMNSPSFTVEVNGVDARAIDARGLAQALAPAMRELIRRGELQLA
jgi:TP901 family phage tail tape measure protein